MKFDIKQSIRLTMDENCMLRGNPIRSCVEDKLERSAVAERIALLIQNDSIHECCTIGVSGAWGSGKSSVINMVCEQLKDSENVFIMNFNPVDYQTEGGDIASLFFGLMITKFKSIRKESKKIGKYGKDNAGILSNSAKAIVSLTRQDLTGLIDNLVEIKKSTSNPAAHEPVDDVREKISDLLKSSGIKLVITVDDIDRLLPGEALQILKLVRITACFDNVVYILGYDEGVLSEQIDKKMGHRYLEKFIQVPVRLPEPNPMLIQKMLLEGVESTISSYGYDPGEYTFQACASVALKTLRDLNILLNRFRFKLAMCPKDVCPEELLALTYIEMKNLRLYDWIFENRFGLCYLHSEYTHTAGSMECSIESKLQEEFRTIHVDKSISSAVRFLYPSLYKYPFYYENYRGIREHIRSTSSCNAFFMLSPSSIPISNDLMDSIFDEGNTIHLVKVIQDCIESGDGRVTILLEKIKARLPDIDYLTK